MKTVFIDGQHGTTGLQIVERLVKRADIRLLSITEADRKNVAVKQQIYDSADVVILCLPETASQEAMLMAAGCKRTRFIDSSTAFRTHPDWTFGLAELCGGQRERIHNARFVANTGCHAAGFILSVRPLVDRGLLEPASDMYCFSITGYSGGGKAMIAEFEANVSTPLPTTPYSLNLQHKHLPEMVRYTGLHKTPFMSPILGHFHSGMLVNIPLYTRNLKKRLRKLELISEYKEHYQNEPFVRIFDVEECAVNGRLNPTVLNGTNFMDIIVAGNDEHLMVSARLDNLGKGASGNAVQCLNLMLDVDEKLGLLLEK